MAHEEEHGAQHAVAAVGDALPGLGIVAAVPRIVHTMDYLDQGCKQLGTRCSGTCGYILGILMSYGYLQPLAAKMGADAEAEGRYLMVMKAALVALQRGAPPLVCVEFARKVSFLWNVKF